MLRTVTESALVPPRRWNPLASLANRVSRFWRRRSTRRLAIRVGLIVGNVALLAIVVAIVVLHPAPTVGKVESSNIAAANTASSEPLDQLASVNIALTVARMTNLLETGAVASQANSESIQLAVASTNNEVVNKPQAISSSFASRKDIKTYTAQAGDTISSIAANFGVSTDSILWSNGLTGNALAVGKILVIPPINGLVYTVKSGDTPASLATKYKSNEAKIVAYNDAEIGGLQTGEQIIIPDGQVATTTFYGYSTGFAWGTSAIYGHNGYDWGNCTWYVATQIDVPANWGNAATWAAGARAAGWHVSSVPSVGAIAQTPYMAYGLGHVAIVDAVSPDGTQVLIRDMNGIAGFARVGIAWQPTSLYPNYITR